MYKFTRFVFLIISLFLTSNFIFAQTPVLPVINEIKVHFNRFQNASEEAVRAHIQIFPGQEYDQRMVSESIRSLYASCLFESIRIQAETLPDNKVDLIFILDPKPKIIEVCIIGNRKIATSRLFSEIRSKVGAPLDESALTCDVFAIKEYYNKHGFSNVEVCYKIDTDPCSGKATVSFNIEEGIKTRIKSITFCGNGPIKARKLRSLIQTKEWNILSIFTGRGRFREELLYEDIECIRQFYRNSGYLDVVINDSDVEITQPTPTTICINITINPGQLYHVGKICISGNTLYPTERLWPLLSVCEGDIFCPQNIELTESDLRDAHGQLGYLDTYVVAERKPNIETGAIDLDFVIHESEKFFVESIKIQGNIKTKSNVIIRELALAPGDVFDLVRLKSSEARLGNTRFFEEVNLLPEETNIPGRRNLLIAVKEGKTGNLQFGITFSTLEKLVGSVEISQSNFDITNWRHGFQGAGQKFRAVARFGKKTNSFTLTFEEPWVCERELAFGVNIFRTEAKYYSSEYDQLTAGFEIYLRKRLFGLVDGQLYYMFEVIDIDNVAKNAAPIIKAEAGKRTVSKVGIGLAYDTRDQIIYPNCGTYLTLNSFIAGGILGGETKYSQLEFTAAQWYPLFDLCNQIFLIGARTGTLMPYGGQSVPFFDRFFLGGPETLRGFGYRQVGPKQDGQPIGGNTYARATAEYSVKVIDCVRFVVFYDWGFVNSGTLDWSPGGYNDNWGVGLRIFILNAPLRLDWGFPIRGTDGNDDKRVKFNFSFGTTF